MPTLSLIHIYLLNAPALPVIQPQKLASPVITWTDKSASWTAVPNARGYLVSLAKGSETLLTETLIETTRDYTCLLYTSRCV